MSLKLQSISQLSSVLIDGQKSTIAEKYAKLLDKGADAFIEVSFKDASSKEIDSFKLDFKQFISDIVSAIAKLTQEIESDFVTKQQLDEILGNYVTVSTEQAITGKKTFLAQETIFQNKIKTRDIEATGTANLTAEHAKWS